MESGRFLRAIDQRVLFVVKSNRYVADRYARAGFMARGMGVSADARPLHR